MYCSVCKGSGLSPGSERFGGMECGACNGTGRASPSPAPAPAVTQQDQSDTTAWNLTGLWSGNDGYGYRLVQTGAQLSVTAYNPWTGQVLANGTGIVFGNAISVSYAQSYGGTGSATGLIRDNGRTLDLTAESMGQTGALQLSLVSGAAAARAPEQPAPQPETSDQESDPVKQAFAILQQQVGQGMERDAVSGTRRDSIKDLMSSIGELVSGRGADRSLDELDQDRSKLNELLQRAGDLARRPSFDAPAAGSGTRAARILQSLQATKITLGTLGVEVGSTADEKTMAMQLYADLGRVSTAYNESDDDPDAVAAIGRDRGYRLAEQARRWIRRKHLTLAQPLWGDAPRQNCAAVSYSGPAEHEHLFEEVCAELDLDPETGTSTGAASAAAACWHKLAGSGVHWFDLSEPDPQVYYELGVALSLGHNLLLTSRTGAEIKFDVEQRIHFYDDSPDELALAVLLDTTLFQIQVPAAGNSIADSIDWAQRYVHSDDELGETALRLARASAGEPRMAMAKLESLNTFLRPRQTLLLPRKPGRYPTLERRCFIVMPFAASFDPVHRALAAAVRSANCRPVRGDEPVDQMIIDSIWDEIGLASKVLVDLTGCNANVCLELGIADTLGRKTFLMYAKGHEPFDKLAAVEKRRCYGYSTPAELSKMPQLRQFLDT